MTEDALTDVAHIVLHDGPASSSSTSRTGMSLSRKWRRRLPLVIGCVIVGGFWQGFWHP
jgi:hypothetical protein